MDLTIKQGETFRCVWAWEESDGTPVSMTGLRARMQVRERTWSPVAQLSLTDDPGGGLTIDQGTSEVHVVVSAALTAQMQLPHGGVFDLELYDPLDLNEVTRLDEGKVTLSPEVTR